MNLNSVFGKLINLKNTNSGSHQWRGVIEEYRDRLPVSSKTPIITLREGGTPLVEATNLSKLLNNALNLLSKAGNFFMEFFLPL